MSWPHNVLKEVWNDFTSPSFKKYTCLLLGKIIEIKIIMNPPPHTHTAFQKSAPFSFKSVWNKSTCYLVMPGTRLAEWQTLQTLTRLLKAVWLRASLYVQTILSQFYGLLWYTIFTVSLLCYSTRTPNCLCGFHFYPLEFGHYEKIRTTQIFLGCSLNKSTVFIVFNGPETLHFTKGGRYLEPNM